MSNNETFAEISKELRGISQGTRFCELHLPTVNGKPLGLYLAEIADRIDAAAERYAPGNAAAIREAREAINRIDTRGLKRLLFTLVEADIFDGGQINKTISAVEKATRALSAPARNCRDTANKMLDHLLYIQQMAANGQQMASK